MQITAVANIGEKPGYPSRRWTKHGMLPFFSYIGGAALTPDPVPQKPATPTPAPSTQTNNNLSQYTDEQLAQMVLAKKFGNNPVRQQILGSRYRAVQDIVERILAGAKPDQVYVVKAGDTLSAIGGRFGVDWMKIAIDNGIANPNLIMPGQKLIIKK